METEFELEYSKYLESVMPKLSSASSSMNCLSASDFTEIKKFKKPHPSIVLCISALSVLLGNTDTKNRSKLQPDELWQKELQKFVGDKNLLTKCASLDSQNIPNNIIKHLKSNYLSNPDFSVENQRANSAACAGICSFICAVITYADISKECAEKKEELARIFASLHQACKLGNIERVNILLSSPDCDIDKFDNNGYTSLIIAIEHDQIDIVKTLIRNKADINKYKENVRNPVMTAIEHGREEILVLLIDNGVIVYNPIQATTNLTPLGTALDVNKQRIIDLLINYDPSCMIEFLDTQFKNPENLSTFIQEYVLPFSLLSSKSYILWFYLIQIDYLEVAPVIASKIHDITQEYPDLAYVQDAKRRSAVDVASPSNKLAIKSVFLWHGRYRITENRPEHVSATCYVYKAIDEMDASESGPTSVALKFMRFKAHYLREINARKLGFSTDYVVDIINCCPPQSVVDSRSEDSYEAIFGISMKKDELIPHLTKQHAEGMFLIVMPLADRNMFVSLKQERYAGKNMAEVRHIFTQLLKCTTHIHSKGMLHADIKTLNIVRVGPQWKLIDLDAAGRIGTDAVGFKSSSAYLPPECIAVIKDSSSSNNDEICIKSPLRFENNIDLLLAHPSFDVWSLGCVLYQMCTDDVRPLFQGGQDDNITDYKTDIGNNLWVLHEWSDSIKNNKLSRVVDNQARNLLSQMLTKDPTKRPTLDRILHHPFLSGKKTARMSGEVPEYDVFISYRVASDSSHAEILYNMLTDEGLKVFWDKKCLKSGEDWKQGFCEGLIRSQHFVCILSKLAINHPEKPWNNFWKLDETSACDNVYLEHRLALELHELGFVDKIFPVMIGEAHHSGDTKVYSPFFGSLAPLKDLKNVCIRSVEADVLEHMQDQGLGTPLQPDRTLSSVISELMKFQGAFVEGDASIAFNIATEKIVEMSKSKANLLIPSATVSPSSLLSPVSTSSAMNIYRDVISAKETEINELKAEICILKEKLLSKCVDL